MTDRKTFHDPNQPPEDVASLYSWANLHGAKYRDFSASRAQNREKSRNEQQTVEEQERAQRVAELQQAEAARNTAEGAAVAERARLAEIEAHQAAQQAAWQAAQRAAQEAAELAARQAAHEAAQQAAAQQAAVQAQQAVAQRAAQEAAELAARQAAYEAEQQAAAQQAALQAQQAAAQRAAQEAAELAARQAAYEAEQQAAAQQAAVQAQQAAERAAQEMAQQAAEHAAEEARAAQARAAQEAEAARAAQQAAQQAAWQQPVPEQMAPLPPSPAASCLPPEPPAFVVSSPASPQPAQRVTRREDGGLSSAQPPWNTPESHELPARPAWLAERPTLSGPVVSQAPEDTLQGSRDRLTSRWFALRGVFDSGSIGVADAAPAVVAPRAPVLAVFSLAGGVGKTSLVATLARALSSRGERVLLVDTAPFGLLPFFFGARDQRPGQLRTFSPPAASGDAPIQLITVDSESLGPENGGQEPLTGEIQQYIRGVGRVIVDLATASGSTTRRILRLSPLVLVPVVPDMNSVVSVGSIDAFFERHSGLAGKPVLPHYVLNQFDASLPLHLDVREVLREQLGDRLLTFALRRAPAVSEALAEGMTVMDYAPNSTVAEDFGSLAAWVKSQSAPAGSGFRGVRWSER